MGAALKASLDGSEVVPAHRSDHGDESASVTQIGRTLLREGKFTVEKTSRLSGTPSNHRNIDIVALA